MSPVSHWPISGGAWLACSVVLMALRRERCGAHRPLTLSPALWLDIRSDSDIQRKPCQVDVGCPSPEPEPNWRTPVVQPPLCI